VPDFVLPTDPPTPPLECRWCGARVDTLCVCARCGSAATHACEECMVMHCLRLHTASAHRSILEGLTLELDAVDLKERADG